MQPHVSVIVVTKNPGPRLERTLASVFAQTAGRIEVVVKDNSTEPLVASQLGRVVLIQRADAGIYDAMNQALAVATGELVYFLNAGDTFHDANVVRNVLDLRDQTRATLVWGDVLRAGQRFRYPRTLHRLRRRLWVKTLCHQSFFCDRHVHHEELRFNGEYTVCADYDVLLRVANSPQCVGAAYSGVVATYEGGGYSECVGNIGPMVRQFYAIRRRRSWAMAAAYWMYRTATLAPLRAYVSHAE